jgi:hypothetical protein
VEVAVDVGVDVLAGALVGFRVGVDVEPVAGDVEAGVDVLVKTGLTVPDCVGIYTSVLIGVFTVVVDVWVIADCVETEVGTGVFVG